MVSCPKCGFTQPPDKYCAKCGVEMSTYVAPNSGGLIQNLLLRNSSFYIFLGVLFLIATGIFISRLPKKSAQENLIVSTPASSRMSARPNQKQKETAPTGLPTSLTPMMNEVEPYSGEEESAPTPATSQISETSKIRASQLNAQGSQDTRATARSPLSFHVIYAEVPTEVLALLGNVQSGTTTQWELIRERIQESPLQRASALVFETEEAALREGQTVTLEHQLRDRRVESKWGFRLNLKLEPTQNGEPTVNMRVAQTFIDSSGRNLGISQLNPTFRMSTGGVGFLQGFAPHPIPVTEVEREALAMSSVLKVYASPHFQSATPQTDLVIFLEPNPTSPGF